MRVKPKEEIIRGLRRREAVCGGSDGERKKRKKKKKKNKRKNMTLDDEDFDMLEENVADYQRPQAVRAVATTPSALLNLLLHCTLSTTCKSSHCLLRPHTSLCAMAVVEDARASLRRLRLDVHTRATQCAHRRMPA